MRKSLDTDPIKHRLRTGREEPTNWSIQQKLRIYFREIQTARHKGRTWDQIARARWPQACDVVDNGGQR